MAKLAFIGSGVMGYPMARHLAQARHEVCVYNRTTAKAEAWAKEHGGQSAASPAAAAAGAEFVFTCVGNDDDVCAVVLGDSGAPAGMEAGAVLVDHTTASAGLARQLEDAVGAANVGFLDAPVSGGQAGVENGALTVMAGGAEVTFERAAPVMESYAGTVQGLSEGLDFAVRAGLDGKRVVDVISRVRRARGRWPTGAPPWSTMNLISASPSIGCARIWVPL